MTAIDVSGDLEKKRESKHSDTLSELFNLSEFGKSSDKINNQAEIATSPELLLAIRRLHAYAYLRAGYVSETDIIDGVLSSEVDSYVDRSTYFTITSSGEVPKPVIVVRQIAYDTVATLPMLEHMTLFPGIRDELESYDLPNCVEISGLSKVPKLEGFYTLLIYRDTWQHSIKQGHDKWFIASDERLTRNLESMFGSSITRIGNTQNYLGSPTDPMLLDSRQGLGVLLRECLSENNSRKKLNKQTLIALLIEGLDQTLLPTDQQTLLAQLFPE